MEQEKEIVISSLAFRKITPKPGAKWKEFLVYQINGNDGITYESTDKDFYSSLKIGEKILIKYKTETKTVNGRVYTSHKIILPDKNNVAMEGLVKQVLDRISLLEKNVLAAIELSCGAPNIPAVDEVDEKDTVVDIIEEETNY